MNPFRGYLGQFTLDIFTMYDTQGKGAQSTKNRISISQLLVPDTLPNLSRISTFTLHDKPIKHKIVPK